MYEFFDLVQNIIDAETPLKAYSDDEIEKIKGVYGSLIEKGCIAECGFFLYENPDSAFAVFEGDALRDFLIDILHALHECLQYTQDAHLDEIMNHSIVMNKVLRILISYRMSGIIVIDDNLLAEIVLNCNQIFQDATRILISGKPIKFAWQSLDEFCNHLNENEIFVQYLCFPSTIGRELYLGQLEYSGFSLIKKNGRAEIKWYKKVNVLKARTLFLIMSAFLRSNADSNRKQVAQDLLNCGYDDSSKQLYNLFLKDIMNVIDCEKTDTIIFSGDMDLYAFPIDLLVYENIGNRSRISSIIYTDSIRFRDTCKYGEKISITSPLFIGNPKYNMKDGAANALAPLPLSRIEVSELANMYGVRPWMKEEAEKELLFSEQYDALHIATHGILFDTDEETSYFDAACLFFSGVDITENDGMCRGILTAADVLGIRQRDLKLVTLSACHSGFGNVQYGMGMVGMPLAFKAIGSQNVVVSLWETDDFATAIFMKEFYQCLITMPISEALRKSKDYIKRVTVRQLIEDGWQDDRLVRKMGIAADAVKKMLSQSEDTVLFREPKYWAGFVVYQ